MKMAAIDVWRNTLGWLIGLLLPLGRCLVTLLYVPQVSLSQQRRLDPGFEAVAKQKQAPCATILDFANTKPISPSFNYADVPARQYRPWHNGPHHVTMGIKRMELDDWVEIDSSYLPRYQEKRNLFRDHPADTLCSRPGSEKACHEALSYLVDFLPRRYPTMFQKTNSGIRNLVTGDDWDLTPSSHIWETQHPLLIMGLLTTEDWLIMQTDADQQTTRLTAGSVSFPGKSQTCP
jgi:hypothetical protein